MAYAAILGFTTVNLRGKDRCIRFEIALPLGKSLDDGTVWKWWPMVYDDVSPITQEEAASMKIAVHRASNFATNGCSWGVSEL